MNRNHRAHIQSAAYVLLGVVALTSGWVLPTWIHWWEQLGLQPTVWWHGAALAGMAMIMLLKVNRPTVALILGVLLVAAETTFGVSLGLLICLTDLIYSHGIRAQPRRARGAEVAFGAAAAGLTILTALIGDVVAALNMLLFSGAVLLVPLWWSAEVRRGYPAFVEDQLRQQLTQQRHADLLVEQETRRRQAVESQRRRMARELHDVVSSQVASIALTSGAVLNAEPDTPRDRQALTTIRTTSVEALDELRQMVSVLRSQGADDETDLLTDTSWEQVLARARARGLSVTSEGSPPQDLPAAVRAVLLRIVQESLTNAHCHGDGAAAVQLNGKHGRLRLRVDSSLRDPAPGEAAQRRGTGLVVMRERVREVGGRLRTGEHQGRWRVEAELPYQRMRREHA